MNEYNKYKNIKTKIKGVTFDSKAESNRYLELCYLQKTGKIHSLKLQPKFLICPGVKWQGKTISKRFYIADFEYYQDDICIIEDVKGVKTSLYSLKKSLFLTQYPQYKFIETKGV